MASQVFYRKWRPKTLSELVSQPHVAQTLLNALKNGNVSHAYLFCGPRGTGKTSTARILAKAVNCLKNGKGEPCNECEMCKAIMGDSSLDVIEIDAASNRGIDEIRDLREKVNYAPTQGRYKVYIIDEFHMLSGPASNALLKTLEEPPPHVIFILATTEAHKVLPTILSRCQHFDFHRLARADVVAKLDKVATAEGIKIGEEALNLIARSATGSLRDAYNLLEQLNTYYGSEILFQQVQNILGITGDWRSKEIIKHIVENDLPGGMKTLNNVVSDGLDLQQFNRELVELLRALLLVKTGATEAVDLPSEDISELKSLAEKISLARVIQAVKLFGQVQLENNESSSLPMELALVDCFLSPAPTARIEANATAGPAPAKVNASVNAAPKISSPTAQPKEQVAAPAPAPKPSAPPPQIKEPTAIANPAAKVIIQPPKPREEIVTAHTAPKPSAETVQAKDQITAASSPSLASEIERLKLNWKQIVEGVDPSLKKTKAIAWLKSGSKPVSMDKDMVVLSFGHKVFKENIEKQENARIVEKIISDYLGHSCKIQCVCETENNHLVKSAMKQGGQIISVEEK
jgi:DNA polymerase III subunit gamma/tau